LVLFAGREWTDDLDEALTRGLASCRRDDAGLLVLVLFPEGSLAADAARLDPRMRDLGERLEAPLLWNEDVRAGWSTALSAPGGDSGAAWRLLSPDGGVVWLHDGRVDADMLSQVLDACLFPSEPARPARYEVPVHDGVLTPGQIDALFGHPHRERAHCPPLSLLRDPSDLARVVDTVSFVNAGSAPTADHVRRLTDEHGDRYGGGPLAVVVIDGADAADAAEVAEALGPGYAAYGDADGSIAASFGVRSWPTSVRVGEPTPVDIRHLSVEASS
jgi:hypothetical protein